MKKTIVSFILILLSAGSFGQGVDLLLCISDTGDMSIVPVEHTHHCSQCTGHEPHYAQKSGTTGISHADSYIHIAIQSTLSSIVLPSRASGERPEQDSDTIGGYQSLSIAQSAITGRYSARTLNFATNPHFDSNLSLSRTVVFLS